MLLSFTCWLCRLPLVPTLPGEPGSGSVRCSDSRTGACLSMFLDPAPSS